MKSFFVSFFITVLLLSGGLYVYYLQAAKGGEVASASEIASSTTSSEDPSRLSYIKSLFSALENYHPLRANQTAKAVTPKSSAVTYGPSLPSVSPQTSSVGTLPIVSAATSSSVSSDSSHTSPGTSTSQHEESQSKTQDKKSLFETLKNFLNSPNLYHTNN